MTLESISVKNYTFLKKKIEDILFYPHEPLFTKQPKAGDRGEKNFKLLLIKSMLLLQAIAVIRLISI